MTEPPDVRVVDEWEDDKSPNSFPKYTWRLLKSSASDGFYLEARLGSEWESIVKVLGGVSPTLYREMYLLVAGRLVEKLGAA